MLTGYKYIDNYHYSQSYLLINIMTDKEKIIKYLNAKGISKNKFYKTTGFSVGFLDSGSSLGVDKLRIIVDNYHDLNANWIVSGHGEMLKDSVPVAKRTENNADGIPLIPVDAMAGIAQGETSVLELDCERFVVPVFKGADYLITVKGSSMYPKYNSGDIVACKNLPLADIFFQWNKVYVVDTVQGALIKRVKKAGLPENICLVSDNAAYDPFEIPIETINAIAIVLGVIRLE